MTKRIETYNDLLEEKQRLKNLLQAQRELIREDIKEIKAELQPLRSAVTVVGKFFNRDTSNPLLSLGASKLIDLLVKKVILGRAGWFTKIAVPFLLKNYSSHVIDDNKGKLGGWLMSLLAKLKRKKKKNKVKEAVEDEDEYDYDEELVQQEVPLK